MLSLFVWVATASWAPAPIMSTPAGDAVAETCSACTALLVERLNIDATSTDAAASLLCKLHSETIVPLAPATYLEGMAPADRRNAIEALSRSLDSIEEAARGPMLTGKEPMLPDASLFPSLVVLEQTLPTHFGWTEWTDEALFWRRPRLHAFFELMKYETPAREVEREVADRIAALEVDWEQLAFEVPTSSLRKYPKHAL